MLLNGLPSSGAGCQAARRPIKGVSALFFGVGFGFLFFDVFEIVLGDFVEVDFAEIGIDGVSHPAAGGRFGGFVLEKLFYPVRQI